MATIKLYFDQRAKRKDDKYPLKVSISHKQQSALISLDIFLLPEQWDANKERIVGHPNRLFLNNYIGRQKLNIETELLNLKAVGLLDSLSGKQIKERIQQSLNGETVEATNTPPLFVERCRKFAEEKKNPRTKEGYMYTLNKVIEFCDEPDKLTFENLSYTWLKDFEFYLSETSAINSISIHMRNIRAVFNDALNSEIISCYPFRKYKIKSEATAKRSLSPKDLVLLRDYPCEEHQRQYLDMFMLIFYLIGINVIDLCNLKEICNGRIEYRRAKTKKLYSIKVEPEALKILEKYKGEKYLLNILDRYKNYKDYAHRLNENLQEIGEVKFVEKVIKGKKRKIKERKPLFPDITTYWARHTWATIAHKIGIPKDTISMALGHEFGCKTTGIYIDYDFEKVEEANRKVIDYINSLD
ncbi:site-specific integrase [Parabacteroides pacaensis]|uniref:site-specific integrase n=1 Tax=Parabacteroides pacaensis TaxID=2086575 RepID=UPI000D0F9F2A|nr:site-specific integrase [Parabacteroides pacaensis]